MIKALLRILTVLVGPERTHSLVVRVLRVVGHLPAGRWMLRKIYAVEHPSLEREVFGMRFKNPIGLAAGFDRNAEAYREFSAMGFGFVEIGTVTPRPQSGNPRPRVFRLNADRAIVNRTGLANKGLDYVMARLRKKPEGVIVGCNIGKNTITPVEEQAADYLKTFRNLYQHADYFTVNISYNTTFKEYVPQSRESVIEILQPLFEFRRGQDQYRPILLKISPDLPDEVVDLMADIMIDTPLDGIVATNATTSREGFVSLDTKLDEVGHGAMSGAPLTKRAIEVVARVYARAKGTYPIIGVGGLMTPEDIKAMLDAGATLVQLYTGFVYEGMSLVRKTCKMMIAEAEAAAQPAEVATQPTEAALAQPTEDIQPEK
ncbi:MAG: quinone-dependent dihydroorotate dehydrogenase [Alistipes sp.]|nr:quinone-dependent dihydroorotate dehydrogenase [Alistipes sp.]